MPVHHVRGKQDFDEQLRLAAVGGGSVVVIDWFAPWCGPCRQIAPHFVQLSSKYAASSVVFLSVDTEDELNAGVAPTPRLTAFPTFEVFSHPGSNNGYYQRSEGANLARVEQCIQEALAMTKPVQVTFTQRGRTNDTVLRFTKEATLHDPACAKGGVMDEEEEVWVMNKRLLDFGRQRGWTLQELGFGADNLVRVLPKARGVLLRMKLVGGGGGGEEEEDKVCRFTPFAKCGAVLHEAKLLTRSSKPRVIFLGKMLDDADKLLSAVVVSGGEATVLCMPGGGELQPGWDKQEEAPKPPAAAVPPRVLPLFEVEEEDIYAVDPLPAAAAVAAAPMVAVTAAAKKKTEEVKVAPVAAPPPPVKLQGVDPAKLSPAFIKAEKMYLAKRYNATAPPSTADDEDFATLKLVLSESFLK